MKHLFLLSLFLNCSIFCIGQNRINAYEYWFDGNYSGKVFNTINPATVFNLSSAITTTGVEAGFHTVNIRFRDDSAGWGSVLTRDFLSQPDLTGYEYWFDNDYSDKVSQSVAPTQLLNISDQVNAASLTPGFHLLNIRCKNQSGVWSLVKSQYIFSQQYNIISYEYWFDNNYSGRTSQTISPSQSLNFSEQINANSLTPGFHYFNFRCQNQSGVWSAVKTSYFLLQTNLVGYEYWIDNNYAAKVSQSVAPTQILNISELVNVGSLTPGFHLFNIRCKNQSGAWSAVLTRVFLPQPDLVGYEYWFDNNYSGKTIQSVSPAPSLHITDSINVDALPVGFHEFNFRTRNQSGAWSAVKSSNFLRLSSSGTENIITAYRYWFDADFASAVTSNIDIPTSVIQFNDSDISLDVDSGLHTLNIQFKDTSQLWSAVLSQSFSKINDSTLHIIAGTVAGPLCRGSSVKVPYTATGYFGLKHVFTAQLSDSTGSFSNPVNVGALSSSTSGVINAVIPFTTAPGTAYKFRVKSSHTAVSNADSSNVTINICMTMQMKAFLEGFYTGNGTMTAVIDPTNYPLLCDTIAIELHDSNAPYELAYRAYGTIDIYGHGSFIFPGSIIGNDYYIVLKHRNAVETWSKNAVTLNSETMSFNFTGH